MPPRRRGRPDLVGTIARTAVIAGTATVVAGSASQQRKSSPPRKGGSWPRSRPLGPAFEQR
jgi:hypothetical protein